METLNFKKGGFKMKTGFKKYIFAVIVLAAATSLTGCFRMGSLFGGGGGNNSAQSIPPGSEGPATAVMEGSQTMATYSALTGVKTVSSATKTAFSSFSSNLPVGGNPAQVAQPTLQAFATIAAGFCDDAQSQNAAQIYPGITFSGAPTQFAGSTLTNVENAMCTNFLHESGCSSAEATILNTATASCVSQVPGLGTTVDGKTVTAAVQTETVGDCLCTIVLASASALAH